MKNQSCKKPLFSGYVEAVNSAKSLQSELINIIDENLLTSWSISKGGLAMSEEISTLLDRFENDSYFRMNPVCVNIIDVLRKVLEVNAKAYCLRDLVNSSDLDELD